MAFLLLPESSAQPGNLHLHGVDRVYANDNTACHNFIAIPYPCVSLAISHARNHLKEEGPVWLASAGVEWLPVGNDGVWQAAQPTLANSGCPLEMEAALTKRPVVAVKEVVTGVGGGVRKRAKLAKLW